MFTGLIEDVGTIARVERRSDACVLDVVPTRIALAELTLGESVCHDGCCLTVTDLIDRGSGTGAFRVLAGAETLARTTLGDLQVGGTVNLERSLRLGDRLGGHWVTGHIDGVATVVSVVDGGANVVIVVDVGAPLRRYVVEKGSIAIASVSLTVNRVDGPHVAVAIIPHTRDHTTLGTLRAGSRVNVEVDLIAKHVEQLVAPFVVASAQLEKK